MQIPTTLKRKLGLVSLIAAVGALGAYTMSNPEKVARNYNRFDTAMIDGLGSIEGKGHPSIIRYVYDRNGDGSPDTTLNVFCPGTYLMQEQYAPTPAEREFFYQKKAEWEAARAR